MSKGQKQEESTKVAFQSLQIYYVAQQNPAEKE